MLSKRHLEAFLLLDWQSSFCNQHSLTPWVPAPAPGGLPLLSGDGASGTITTSEGEGKSEGALEISSLHKAGNRTSTYAEKDPAPLIQATEHLTLP